MLIPAHKPTGPSRYNPGDKVVLNLPGDPVVEIVAVSDWETVYRKDNPTAFGPPLDSDGFVYIVRTVGGREVPVIDTRIAYLAEGES